MKAFSGAQALVMKIGGSCFGGLPDYHRNAESLARFQQLAGVRLVLVVSAAKGKTDELIIEAREDFPGDPWSQARLVAEGEDISARQLFAELAKLSAQAQIISATDIDLLGWGGDDPFNGDLLGVSADKLLRIVEQASITVVPGYYAIDKVRRRRVLLGRGATDLIAVSLAGALGADCLFCKDGGGVYVFDPRLAQPKRSPKQISRLSYDQAHGFASSGHGFLMPKSLLLAKQKGVKLYFVPSPAAENAWQVGAVIGKEPADDGVFVGVQAHAYLNAVSCACITVTQWGEVHLNGRLEELVSSCVKPFAMRVSGGQTKIYLPARDIQPLVDKLSCELNLLEPA